MNVLLWIVQALLALLLLAGGSFKFLKPEDVASQIPALPLGAWRAIGVLEVLGGVLLIAPAATKWLPVLTPAAAAVLLVEALALSILYASYSLQLTAANPLVWSATMAILLAFVTYGRFSLAPLH